MKNWPQRRSGYSAAGWLPPPQCLGGLVVQMLVAAFLFTAANLHAAQAVQAWVQRYDSGNGPDAAQALAADAAGNVYVTGYSMGTNGNLDFASIAYATTGAPLWTNRYEAGNANSIAADPSSGTVYVTGTAYRQDGYGDFATIAYSSAGKQLWERRFNSSAPTYAGAAVVAVGAEGSVVVCGGFYGVPSAYATLAYSSTGTPLWTNYYRHSSGRSAQPQAMTIDGHGNVYITGWSYNPINTDYATIAYSSSGIPLWTNRYTGPVATNGTHTALAVTADALGRVYVTGYSQGFGTGHDFATIAYSGTGAALWTNRYNGAANDNDIAVSVATDLEGHVYVTGASGNKAGGADFATIAYSNSGAPLWTNFFGAGTNLGSSALSVASDGRGNIIVAGYSTGLVTGRDYAILAYSSTGIPLWTNRYDGPASGSDQIGGSQCLAIGTDGAIYVTGESDGIDDSDYATIKYVPAPDILFRKVQPLPGAGIRLTISAPTNTPYRLEASPDLAHWQTLTNFPPLPFQRNRFTDPAAPGNPRRFYRTVWSP